MLLFWAILGKRTKTDNSFFVSLNLARQVSTQEIQGSGFQPLICLTATYYDANAQS